MGRGRTPQMPELEGMMSAEDVAKSFSSCSPAPGPTAFYEYGLPPADGVVMGVDGPVRWGFLSTANINDKLLPGARHLADVDVVAVASRDAGRAEAYARERGIERAYGSYEELLADPEVEAVYISLPNSMHVEWSIRALEAGKHVLCEKPLSRHPEDVERAFDAAEKAGRILMEAFMYRHNPQTKRLVELVEGGAIGRLRLVRAAFSFPHDEDRGQHPLPRRAGGPAALMDVGCYCG